MKVKIDTKEKFHVITVEEENLSANLTEDMKEVFDSFLTRDVKHVVINMANVVSIDDRIAEQLCQVQQVFYENNCSFVICELNSNIETFLDEKELLEVMNITPTESEAWDIVLMEEIERELMDED